MGCSTGSVLAEQLDENRFLRVQTVFRFVKNLLCMCFKDFGGDLLTAVGGQAVLYHCVGVRCCEEFVVDLIDSFKDSAPLFRFALLTH